MSEHTLYTLAKALQNTTGLEKDFSQMLSTLHNTIEKEYLLKIRSAADREKTFAVEHPPKEVTLLRALSAFTDESGKQQIDRITQSLLFVHTLQHIQKGVEGLEQNGTLLEARSVDGTSDTELPSKQAAHLAGLLLTLALAEHF